MKRSRTAALLLMSAAPLLLTACSQDQAREGLYTSVDACVAATNDRQTCQEAMQQASAEAVAAAPRYATKEECIAAHGAEQCEQRTQGGQSFFGPFMTGFLLSQMMRGGANASAGAPAFRDSKGQWQRPVAAPSGGVYRPGALGGATAMAPVSATPNAAPTVSRGGFGSSSAGRDNNSSGG